MSKKELILLTILGIAFITDIVWSIYNLSSI